jgi:hypothetical protein
MSEKAVIGIEQCGCVTMAHARPEKMTKDFERDLVGLIRRGGKVEHTTVAGARPVVLEVRAMAESR